MRFLSHANYSPIIIRAYFVDG